MDYCTKLTKACWTAIFLTQNHTLLLSTTVIICNGHAQKYEIMQICGLKSTAYQCIIYFYLVDYKCVLTCPSWPTCTWWIWRFPWNTEMKSHDIILLPHNHFAILTSKKYTSCPFFVLLLALTYVDNRLLRPALSQQPNWSPPLVINNALHDSGNIWHFSEPFLQEYAGFGRGAFIHTMT